MLGFSPLCATPVDALPTPIPCEWNEQPEICDNAWQPTAEEAI